VTTSWSISTSPPDGPRLQKRGPFAFVMTYDLLAMTNEDPELQSQRLASLYFDMEEA
jgi:hypothetical protein